MNRRVDSPPSRRLHAPFLAISAGISNHVSAGAIADAAFGELAWVGCHGGAGVSTLAATTGMGRDCGAAWPPAARVDVPTVLVCRATGSGSMAAAAAVEQWSHDVRLRHIRLLGLVTVAAAPMPAPKPVRDRLRLVAGWVPSHWFVGWQAAYLAADDSRLVGATPQILGLRAHLVDLLQGHRS